MTGMLMDWFEDIFGSGIFKAVEDVLCINPSTGDYSAVWNAIYSVYTNVMVPIALGLMLIWFLVALMEKSATDQVTIEQVLMLFVKLIAAKFLIDFGFELFAKLWGLGNSLVAEVGEAFSDGDATSFDYKELWKEMTGKAWGKKLGLFKSIGLMCQLLLPWLASKIIIACIYFICYSRLIEMLLRLLAAPVAVSDFITEGLHGSGWKYLKNFLAICLQGMIIVAIAQLYPLVMSGVFTNLSDDGFWTIILKQLAFSFSAIALMFKSLSISKELVGTA